MDALKIASQIITFRAAELAEIMALRHAVLRAGLPLETARFAGDELPTTRHFGAFVADAGASAGHSGAGSNGRNIACATLHESQWEGRAAWQLRGMATGEGWRGKGIGAALWRFAEGAVLAESPVRMFWCNARTTAAGFYVRHGWKIVSEEFVIPTAGPHVRMVKEIAAS